MVKHTETIQSMFDPIVRLAKKLLFVFLQLFFTHLKYVKLANTILGCGPFVQVV